MAGILPPARAATHARIKVQPTGKPIAGGSMSLVSLAPVDGIQERIMPLTSVRDRNTTYRVCSYRGANPTAPNAASGSLRASRAALIQNERISRTTLQGLPGPQPPPTSLAPSIAALIPNERISSLRSVRCQRTLVLLRPSETGRSSLNLAQTGSCVPAVYSGRMVMTSSSNMTRLQAPHTYPPRGAGAIPPGAETSLDVVPSPPPSPPSSPTSQNTHDKDKVLPSSSRGVASASHAKIAPPDAFNCPIGHTLMVDPVTCADGHSYERENIKQWLQVQRTSSLTGMALQALPNIRLTPDHALRKAIHEWLEETKQPSHLQLRLGSLEESTIRPHPPPAKTPAGKWGKLVGGAPPALAPPLPAYRLAPPAPPASPAPSPPCHPIPPSSSAVSSSSLNPGKEIPGSPHSRFKVGAGSKNESPSVTDAVQQRLQRHSKVAPQSPLKTPITLPVVVSPAWTVGGAFLAHGWAGFIVAVAGETSISYEVDNPTTQFTPPQAVHLFCSALVLLLCGVCVTLTLDDDTSFDTPWSGLSGLLTAATAGGLTAVATLFATLAQRGVFAYASGLWLPIDQKTSVLRLTIGWLLNLGLYGVAAAGAYGIAEDRLDNSQMTIGFPTRAAMALLWNLCATEPLSALIFATVIRCHNNWHRPKQG